MNIKPSLSKSQFVKGLQCPKALWLYKNNKDLATPASAQDQARFGTGNDIGNLAMRYFAHGIEVKNEYWDISGGVATTNNYINDGYDVIYEATAIHPINGCYARIDILQKDKDSKGWNLIEVKSSTSVKDYHINDLSFQYYVFVNAGFKINKCYVMVIDKQYIKNGDIDPNQFFTLHDTTAEIEQNYERIEHLAPQFLTSSTQKQSPHAQIGSRCSAPFECEFKNHCWRDVPNYNIYHILTNKKADEIGQERKSFAIDDLNEADYPSGVKIIDIQSYKNDQTHIEKDNIADWLGLLQYPLYFLDYETMMPAIPVVDGTKPFQQIPFQFSLHIQHKKGSDTQHIEFLHQDISDPRHAFAEALIDACAHDGSIIVYNQAFEKSRNLELASLLPQYQQRLFDINYRVIDLLVPFKKRWLYHHQQKSSASIKAVLPTFTDLTYHDLDIANGGDAMDAYLRFMMGQNSDHDKLFSDLKRYCQLDTFAMVKLLAYLYDIIDD